MTVDHDFDCPIAGHRVVFTVDVRQRRGFPPTPPLYKSCTGIDTCGIRSGVGNDATYTWPHCPMHRKLNSGGTP